MVDSQRGVTCGVGDRHERDRSVEAGLNTRFLGQGLRRVLGGAMAAAAYVTVTGSGIVCATARWLVKPSYVVVNRGAVSCPACRAKQCASSTGR